MERSAGFVVFRRGEDVELKFLLLHYRAGHWDFPKGHIEPGESDIGAARRETREEAGLVGLVVVRGFSANVSYFFSRDGRRTRKDVVYFLAESRAGDVVLSHEHTNSEWLSYGGALRRLTFSSSRDVLRKASEFIKSMPNSMNL